MMNAQQYPVTEQRSAFVTAVAWTFIVLGLFTTLMALAQSALVSSILSRPEVVQASVPEEVMSKTPELMVLFFSNLGSFLLCAAVVSAVSVVAAIGLLLRRNWGRLLFIAMMVFGILWNLGAVAMQVWMRSWIEALLIDVPQDEAAPVMAVVTVILVVSTVFSLVFCILFGWIAWRLASPAVKQEFGALRY